MSLKPENGIKFRPEEYELVIFVRKMSPSSEKPYGWEENVSVFVNGKETGFLSLSVDLDGSNPAPVVVFNKVKPNEDNRL